MPSLRIERPNQSPLVYRLQSAVTSIGRARYNNVTLADPLVPDIALQIRFEAGSYFISVLDPDHCPLLVNGKSTRQHRLLHRDRLRLGSTEIVFWDEEESAMRPRLTTIKVENILEQLASFSRRISQETGFDELLETLMDGAITITGADKGFLVLFDGEEAQVRVARNCQRESLGDIVAQMSDSILATVRQTRQPVIVEDILQSAEYYSATSIRRLGLTSVMCLPLLEREHVVGLLYVGRHFVTDLLNPRTLAPLTVLATQGALLIRNALLARELRFDTKRMSEAIESMRLGEVIGACSAMQEVFRQIVRVATMEAPVLIVGEEGTGKELVAREIHRRGLRAAQPFVNLHCGVLTERFIEGEVCGPIQDALPGSASSRLHRWLTTTGITLFLDEVESLSPEVQTRLARTLEEHAVTRLGSDQANPFGARIIAASRRDLTTEVAAGRFREDLLRQVEIVRITLPPLRERGEDLLLLAKYFLDRHAYELDSLARGFALEAVQVMRRYTWPGNVRQLEHHVKRAAALAKGSLIGVPELGIPADTIPPLLPLDKARDRFEHEYVRHVLSLYQGNRVQAARALGMDRRTLYRYLGEREEEEGESEPAEYSGRESGAHPGQ